MIIGPEAAGIAGLTAVAALVGAVATVLGALFHGALSR